MPATLTPPAASTLQLYGPNDHHLEVAGQDEKGRPLYTTAPGLGPEADAQLLAAGGTRAERSLLDAERAAIARERQELDEDRAQLARELASLPASVRAKLAASRED